MDDLNDSGFHWLQIIEHQTFKQFNQQLEYFIQTHKSGNSAKNLTIINRQTEVTIQSTIRISYIDRQKWHFSQEFDNYKQTDIGGNSINIGVFNIDRQKWQFNQEFDNHKQTDIGYNSINNQNICRQTKVAFQPRI